MYPGDRFDVEALGRESLRMTELLLPGSSAREPGATPFDRNFFVKNFHSDEAPVCDLYAQGEVPVVELELVNGTDCDVYYFEAFRRDFLVASAFHIQVGPVRIIYTLEGLF